MRLSKKTVNESLQQKSGRSKAIYDWAKDYILDHIDDWEGQSVYGADFAFDLTEEPNVNGIYEDDSRGFIKDHFDDAGEEYKYQKNNFGKEGVKNPFDDPEGFVVVWLIDSVGDILAGVPVIEENWNNSFELTPEVILDIKEAL